MENSSKIKTFLIITSSGGGGLLQSANAQAQRLRKEDPNSKIIVKDLMLEWLGRFLGTIFSGWWNKSQKKGKVYFQVLLAYCQRAADYIFWPIIFVKALRTLIKEDVDYVYDTQVLSTSAIIKAVRAYNFLSKKELFVKKIFVDLPSKKSTHYYNNIKRLSKKDKKYIFVSTIEPQLEKDQTQAEFWMKYCSLPLDKICYKSYPIRLGFDSYLNKVKEPIDYKIKTKAQNDEEMRVIEKVVSFGNIESNKSTCGFEFIIKPTDFLITVLLGSQPAFDGTISYVQNLINFVKENKIKKNLVIFPYCSKFEDGLIKKMHDMILKVKDLPKNLTIIPMSFQDEDVIALLFFRSDITITRSGGQTAVELLRVSKAKICIHSEYKGKDPTEKNLLKGIPAWEAGAADYMKELMNASIITPDLFTKICGDLIVS